MSISNSASVMSAFVNSIFISKEQNQRLRNSIMEYNRRFESGKKEQIRNSYFFSAESSFLLVMPVHSCALISDLLIEFISATCHHLGAKRSQDTVVM